MPRRKYRIFSIRRSFKKEFKRQLRFAIMAAVGFLIAFAWRNAIYNSSRDIVEKFLEVANTPLTEVYTAIFITLMGVALIFLTSKFLRDKR